MRIGVLLLWLASAASFSGGTSWADATPDLNGQGPTLAGRQLSPRARSSSPFEAYPAVADSELASLFTSWRSRDARVQPEKVMAALSLHPGQVVADLGAGRGYFSFRLAQAVGAAGKVLALDISEKSLAINKRVAGVFGLTNIENRIVPPDDPQLKPGEAEVIFVSYTWQFLDDRLHYATLLRNALREGGVLAVLGLDVPGVSHRDSSKSYPWTNKQEVWREAEAAGFSLRSDHSLQNEYYLLFHAGISPIFEQIPGLIYVTSNLAIGDAGPDSAGCQALRARGFRQILDLRRNVYGALSGTGCLKRGRLPSDEPAGRDTLGVFLNDMDSGITYAYGDSISQVATFVLSAFEAGLYGLSDFELDRLMDLAHP